MNTDFQRIVHLDLKGAPWTVDYLSQVIVMAKKWGATGILFEWEDTFPFTGELTLVGSLGGSNGEGLYIQSEIQHLLQVVKDNEMIPIQLIQIIGHLEYVLKHGPFRAFRELSHSPAVLCPTQTGSKTLIETMVTQILDIQPDAEYLHIGADEAWHMNVCSDCRTKSDTHKHGPVGLYLDHVTNIASFVKAMRPDITVLMWDDMLRNIDEATMKDYTLGELVQPVVWNYNPMTTFSLDIHMWERYNHVFPKMWAGSAFKGANGSCQIMTPVERYVSNQQAWIDELKIYEDEIRFGGVILTGWSRYDHYATLCELLPVALPSLSCCIKMWTRPEDVPMEQVVVELLPSDEWPGEQLARTIHTFVSQRERTLMFLNGDQILTWLNTWHISHNYTNPLQLEGIAACARRLLSDLTITMGVLKSHMSIMGPRSASEWCVTFSEALSDKLQELINITTDSKRSNASVAPKSDKRRPCD